MKQFIIDVIDVKVGLVRSLIRDGKFKADGVTILSIKGLSSRVAMWSIFTAYSRRKASQAVKDST